MAVDYERIKELGRELLLAIGEDPDRPGLLETPRRWADFWSEFVDYDPGRTGTIFESVDADQIVVVSGIRLWSVCEHHLLPFWCELSVGYIPHECVLGLSKFSRVANKYAHSLQIQERLVSQIATDIQELTGTQDVAVLAVGEHLCMTMRGIKSPALMKSSVMRGSFRDNAQTRSEFLAITGLKGER